MRKPFNLMIISLSAALLMTGVACNKTSQNADSAGPVPAGVLQQISKLGFSTAGVRQVPEGYVVEGDILLKPSDLDVKVHSPVLRIAEVEQYRTSNLITGLPRTITISISGLPATYTTALDNAIARYNTLGLRLSFQRVSSGGQIEIQYASLGAGYLGQSAGFPNSAGNPASPIRLNSDWDALGPNPDVNYLTTVIAHEIGHAIGFRHTDYYDRTFSGCTVGPNNPANEGWASVGAIHIYGTPTTANAASWMLACIGTGVNRPFNFNDIIALRGLYGAASPSCGGPDKRIINGSCQTASRIIISAEYDDLHDRCYIAFYYRWSNGEIDYEYNAIEQGQCP